MVEIITYDIDFPQNFSGVTIKEEGSNVGVNINTINFVGSAITATATGTASTISIDAQPPLNSDSQITVGIITIGSATTINSTGIEVVGIITCAGIAVTSNGSINGDLNVQGTITSSNVSVVGDVFAPNGFVSTANTTPIQIQLVGNLLTFEAVGIGSTTFILF